MIAYNAAYRSLRYMDNTATEILLTSDKTGIEFIILSVSSDYSLTDTKWLDATTLVWRTMDFTNSTGVFSQWRITTAKEMVDIYNA
jgi:hypothetical protein